MRTLLIALIASLALCLNAWAASGIALSVADLTPAEAQTYQTLKDEKAKSSFLVTRGYVRLCQKVVANELPALDLPARTDEYDDAYVSDEELTIVNQGMLKNIGTMLSNGKKR
jgi:hypothetical protein